MPEARILIVEDEAIVARDISWQLTELGYVVAGQAREGEEAVAKCGDLRPDLVLMDIHLAGQMDGIQAATAIRRDFGTPVVFLTAFADDQVVNRAKVAQPYGYVVKPFDQRELRTTIEMALYRRHAEAREREWDEELAAILRTALDGFLVMDRSGRILEANDAAGTMHGCSREEMLTRSMAELSAAPESDGLAAELRRVEVEGEGRLQRRHRHRTRGTIFVEISCKFRPKMGGRFIAFLRDVSSSRRAQEITQVRLRVSEFSATHSLEALLQKTLDEAEALTDSVIGFFHFVEADQQTLRLQTWSSNTLAKMCTAAGKGQHYSVDQAGVWVDCLRERRPVIHNDYASLPHRKGLPAGHAPVIRELVVPVIRNDRVVAIFGVGNKPSDYVEEDVESLLSLANYCWDILGRKRAEEAHRESEAHIEALLNVSTEAMFMLDRAGTVLVANPQLARRLGKSSEDLTGRCIFDLLPPEVAATRRAQMDQAFATGKPVRFVDSHARRWVEHNLVPIRNGSGEATSLAVYAVDITERKLAAEAMQAEQERLRLLFRSAPVGISISVRRTILEVNDVFCEITGYSREELVGQGTRFLYFSSEEFDRIGGIIAGKVLTEGHASSETNWKRKNGARVDVVLSASRFRWTGEEAALVATVLDITERKRIEEELSRSESRLRQAQKIFRLGVWDWDLTTDTTHWSEEMFAIYGITPESFTGRGSDYLEYTHPDDRAMQRANIEEAMGRAAALPPLERSAEPKQFRIVRPDGSVCWVEGDAEVVTSENGVPLTMVGTLVDITARKRIEADLRESTALLQKAQSLARLGSYKFEISRGRWTSSPELDEIFGIGADYDRSVAGWLNLIAPDQRAELTNYLETHVLTEHRRFEKEYRIVRASDHQERWVSGLGELEFDGAGMPILMHGTIQDITERKLLETQFRQAQKMELVGQLAGGVAHDFNNILTAMTLNLELLHSADLPVPARGPVAEIEAMAKRAARLTQQLLMFARRQAMQVTTVEINAAMTSLLKMLQRLLGEHVTLNFVSRVPALWVEADPGMLDQAVMNLCINARDAMPSGGTLTLATDLVTLDAPAAAALPEGREGTFACISVQDTGMGMEPEVVQHLFEPFFTTKEIGKGTGLGLASLHGIVHQHRGWVNVTSAVGQGTTFRVYLPWSAKKSLPAHKEPPPTAEESFPGGKETILLAEDEAVVRKVTAVMLRRLGYQVVAAENGPEACRLWEEHSGAFDLLFADMVMPGGMTGLQLADTLRQRKPALKIVLMSGYSAEIIKGDALATANVAFLPKPFEVSTLATTIRRCLDAAPV